METQMAKIKVAPRTDILKYFPDMEFPKESQFVQNPFSGEGTTVTPEAYSLYLKVKQLEIEMYHNRKVVPKFHKAIALFQKHFPSEYFTLLD